MAERMATPWTLWLFLPMSVLVWMGPPFLYSLPIPFPVVLVSTFSPRTFSTIITAYFLIRTFSRRFSLFPLFSVFCFGLSGHLLLWFPIFPPGSSGGLFCVLQPVPLSCSPRKALWVLSSFLLRMVSPLSGHFPGNCGFFGFALLYPVKYCMTWCLCILPTLSMSYFCMFCLKQ